MRRTRNLLCHVLVVLLGPVPMAALAAEPKVHSDVFAVNRMLGRGINLGNALEAPAVGEWGMDIQSKYLHAIAEAGFDSLRLPVRWSAHAETSAPYKIDSGFFAIVDDVINESLSLDLAIVVNFHHYEELYVDPDKEQSRLLALWRQVAERYQDRPVQLVFEILNEPHGELSHERWQTMFPRILSVIRETNPERAVIVGPGQWNNVDKLPELRLPENDRMLIGTFHYYNPFRFTHQQASWVEGAQEWRNIPWNGTPEEVKVIAEDFDKAERWSKQHNRPVFLGEFGAYSGAELRSRARWTETVAREARERGFSFAYWEFGAGFGAYDRDSGKWRESLKNALLASDR